ncbi:hypothetical protein L3Q82_017772 [Scortum barcoo]|uniref:Uncharacterized protein n=1 Tax=Scortum barcoo TaxID=214431 RepID=A0ACB8VPZ7_9TELE|nr:hypothetical protein L3Q82_017772 [Scortum barcoo]
MEVGDSASGVANRGGGPSFVKGKGDLESVFQLQGDHTSQPPRKGLYARVLERRIRPIVAPSDSGRNKEQCGFRPGRGTLDQLYTLRRVLEGLWEFAQPVHMCFVDLEKAFDRVPRGILWGVLREYGVRGPLLRAVLGSLCNDRSRSLVRIAGTRTFSVCWSGLQPSVKCWLDENQHLQIRGHGSLTGKGWRALSGWVERSCLKWRSSSISGSCSRVRERWSVRLTGGLVQRIRSYAGAVGVPDHRGEEGAEPKGEALDLRPVNLRSPHLTYGHELWVMNDRKDKIMRIQAAEMSFLRRVAGRSLRDRVRSSVTREELGVEPLLLHIERSQLRWLGHLFRMPPGRLPREVFQACPTGRRPSGKTQDTLERLCLCLGWPGNASGSPLEELEEVSGVREVWASLLRLLPPRPGPG